MITDFAADCVPLHQLIGAFPALGGGYSKPSRKNTTPNRSTSVQQKDSNKATSGDGNKAGGGNTMMIGAGAAALLILAILVWAINLGSPGFSTHTQHAACVLVLNFKFSRLSPIFTHYTRCKPHFKNLQQLEIQNRKLRAQLFVLLTPLYTLIKQAT